MNACKFSLALGLALLASNAFAGGYDPYYPTAQPYFGTSSYGYTPPHAYRAYAPSYGFHGDCGYRSYSYQPSYHHNYGYSAYRPSYHNHSNYGYRHNGYSGYSGYSNYRYNHYRR